MNPGQQVLATALMTGRTVRFWSPTHNALVQGSVANVRYRITRNQRQVYPPTGA